MRFSSANTLARLGRTSASPSRSAWAKASRAPSQSRTFDGAGRAGRAPPPRRRPARTSGTARRLRRTPLGLLPLAAPLGDLAPVQLDLFETERVDGALQEAERLLVVPLRLVHLAQGEPHLDAGEERPSRAAGVVSPVRGLPGLREVIETVLRMALAHRDREVVVRARELGPIGHRAELRHRAFVPLDGDRLHVRAEQGERIPHLDREGTDQAGVAVSLEELEGVHVLVERSGIVPPLEREPRHEPVRLRDADRVAGSLEQVPGLEGPLGRLVRDEVLAGDLGPSETESSGEAGFPVPGFLEGLAVVAVGGREVPYRVVQVPERFRDHRLLPSVALGQGRKVEEHPLEVVDRALGLLGLARLLGGPPVELEGLGRHLPEEVVAAQVSVQLGRRSGADRFERFSDLAVQHAQPTLGQRAVDPGAELLLGEREPVPARALDQDPLVYERLQVLGQLLLVRRHGGDEEMEIEFGADRARVHEDPMFLRCEVAGRGSYRPLRDAGDVALPVGHRGLLGRRRS